MSLVCVVCLCVCACMRVFLWFFYSFFNYICFNCPDCYLCYLKAEKEGMELDGWGCREDLGQDVGGGTMIRI